MQAGEDPTVVADYVALFPKNNELEKAESEYADFSTRFPGHLLPAEEFFRNFRR